VVSFCFANYSSIAIYSDWIINYGRWGVKIKLVFNDWQVKGKSIYNTEKGVELSMGDFHSGSTFNREIRLDDEQAIELHEAFNKGFNPVFIIYRRN
jgi:hypothetical protein